MFWQTTRFRIDLARPKVMGIVNVTPDSFSDGGRHGDASTALAHCEQLLAEGADILDIGGESSRPGAAPVPVEQELARVLPVIQGALQFGVPLSVDTVKPEVMQRVLDLGADIVQEHRSEGEACHIDHQASPMCAGAHVHGRVVQRAGALLSAYTAYRVHRAFVPGKVAGFHVGRGVAVAAVELHRQRIEGG